MSRAARTLDPVPDSVIVEGTVARIVFHNPSSSYTVLRLETGSQTEPLTVVGKMFGVVEGVPLRIAGKMRQHPRYGAQLECESFTEVTPATLTGIERYLASGAIPGIGVELARRIVAKFGMKTLEILDENPNRLREIPGIGKRRIQRFAEAWRAQRAVREVMVFLQGYGVSAAMAARIHRRYGDEAISVVRENPYRLAVEVWGIGFRIADRIAAEVGIPKDSPLRAVAGILHVLRGLVDEGHTFVPRGVLLDSSIRILEIDDRVLLETCLAELARDHHVFVEEVSLDDPGVYPADLYAAETHADERIREILASSGKTSKGEPRAIEAKLEAIEKKLGMELASAQRQAIIAATQGRFVVITGGPGVGKTTTLRGLLELLEMEHLRVALAAPTGRAAKRMSEATGRPAQTLHRLLEFNPRLGAFQRDRADPLDADVVCVDETSMVDIVLFAALLDALPDHARLVLLGDVDQLPSVGPGLVLAEIIASGKATVVRLTEVFRQAAKSQIVAGAHCIHMGKVPEMGEGGDLYFIERAEPEAALETIRELCAERIPRRFGFVPMRDVQVLSPMHRGLCGAQNLNLVLQDALNPLPGDLGSKETMGDDSHELVHGSRRFRPGDRVMQIRNDYDREVWNGDIGRVLGLDPEKREMTVEIDGRSVLYPYAELDALQLAYACSVHKAQGSEFPAVVIPLVKEHHIMLQRNLLYTALTRARRLAVLVGSTQALERAVANDRIRHRYSFLAGRLRGSSRWTFHS